jgi:hypothetical protein
MFGPGIVANHAMIDFGCCSKIDKNDGNPVPDRYQLGLKSQTARLRKAYRGTMNGLPGDADPYERNQIIFNHERSLTSRAWCLPSDDGVNRVNQK